jgi:transposase
MASDLARASRIRLLQTFANTLEGTNNRIKTLQCQAYGYRDREFFELKIFAIHHARYELVG